MNNDEKKVLEIGFHFGVNSHDLTTRPVQLGAGRVNHLVHPSPYVEVRPVREPNGTITAHKYIFADGTVFYLPVAEDVSASFTAGPSRS